MCFQNFMVSLENHFRFFHYLNRFISWNHLQNVENPCLRLFFLYLQCSLQMVSFMKVKCMVLACFFVNVDLCECEIVVLDNLIKKKKCWRCWFSPFLSVSNIRTTLLKQIFSFLFFFREWPCGFSQTWFIPNLTCVEILFSCFIQDRKWGSKFVVKETSLAFPGVKILISRGQLACF